MFLLSAICTTEPNYRQGCALAGQNTKSNVPINMMEFSPLSYTFLLLRSLNTAVSGILLAWLHYPLQVALGFNNEGLFSHNFPTPGTRKVDHL